MQEDEYGKQRQGKRITWNGGALGAGLTVACGGGGCELGS